jgi:hypothetical protein
LEIEKIKPTFVISVLKVEYILGGLNFFEIQLPEKEICMEKSTFLRRFAFRRKRLIRGQQFNCHEILKCKGLKNEMLLTKKVLGPRVKRSLRSKTLEVISMLPCIPK